MVVTAAPPAGRYEKQRHDATRFLPKDKMTERQRGREGRTRAEGGRSRAAGREEACSRGEEAPPWVDGWDIPHSQTLGGRLGTACNEVW